MSELVLENAEVNVTSRQKKSAAIRQWLLFSLITVALAILLGGARTDMFTLPDSDAYLNMASGHQNLVPAPYTSRQLGPLLIKEAHQYLSANIYAAYTVEGVLALLLLVGFTVAMLSHGGERALPLVMIGGMAFWAALYNGLVLPDLLFAALLSIFLFFLQRDNYLAAALMMFPLTLTRESTILVLACLLIACWRQMRSVNIGIAIVSFLAGGFLVKKLAMGGLGNNDGLGGIGYLIGKVVWNFPRNVLGLQMWSNVSNNNPCVVPGMLWHVYAGGIRAVGICGYSPALTLCTVRTALTCFGLLPLLLFFLWRKRSSLSRAQGSLLRFCIFYGCACFVLAPELGPSLPRLFGYAWPAFAIAAPLLALGLNWNTRAGYAFLALHLLASWSMWFIGYVMLSVVAEAALAAALLVAYVGGWILLRALPVHQQQTSAA